MISELRVERRFPESRQRRAAPLSAGVYGKHRGMYYIALPHTHKGWRREAPANQGGTANLETPRP